MDTPVIISALVMGMLLTERITFLLFLPIFIRPKAVKVPNTVAMAAASTDTIMVVPKALIMEESWNSSTYHFREKPVQLARLLDSLNENAMSTKMGA
jgi:hypothetical protein